jgi:hypothetical protein
MFFKKETKNESTLVEVLPSNEDLSIEQEDAIHEKDLYDDHGCAIVGERNERVVFLTHLKNDGDELDLT